MPRKFLQPKILLPGLVFTALLAIGLSIYDDYGITWDDPDQRQLGLVTFDYMTGKTDSITANSNPLLDNRYHNPFIELVNILPEKILDSHSLKTDFLLKHLTVFMFSWIGFIFFYLLALEILGDYKLALVTLLMLIFTPRIFAHSFFNSKDIPVLYLFVINMYCFIRWLKKPSWLWLGLFTLASGLLTGARIIGLMMPVMAVTVCLILQLTGNFSRRKWMMLFVYLVLYPFAVYLFYPSIWSHPFTEMEHAISMMSHFQAPAVTLFMGKPLESVNTPWYFVPVWMGITLPIGWWIFLVVGLSVLLVSLTKITRKHVVAEELILIIWIVIPLISLLLLKPNLYDDARHFYFIYPPVILIAGIGLKWLFGEHSSKTRSGKVFIRATAASVLMITFIYLSVFMIRYHPFQQTYFNVIGRKYANKNFEKDYWGLSYRNALEFLVAHDHNTQIKLCWTMAPCESNLVWLQDADQRRIHWTNFRDCDYFVTIFKSRPPFPVPGEKIYEINVDGVTILDLYKMNPPNNYDLPIY